MIRTLAFCFLLATTLTACGGADNAPADTPTPVDGLTAEQLENGIGPIETVRLEPLNADLASTGEAVYNMKCAACHKMESRYVGPALGDVTLRRSPAYIMNMILNPGGMLEKHPEVKAMLAEYMNMMPNQNLTEDDARAVLEYLRQQASPTAP